MCVSFARLMLVPCRKLATNADGKCLCAESCRSHISGIDPSIRFRQVRALRGIAARARPARLAMYNGEHGTRELGEEEIAVWHGGGDREAVARCPMRDRMDVDSRCYHGRILHAHHASSRPRSSSILTRDGIGALPFVPTQHGTQSAAADSCAVVATRPTGSASPSSNW